VRRETAIAALEQVLLECQAAAVHTAVAVRMAVVARMGWGRFGRPGQELGIENRTCLNLWVASFGFPNHTREEFQAVGREFVCSLKGRFESTDHIQHPECKQCSKGRLGR